MPKAEINARTEIGEPGPSLGMTFDCESWRHTVAEARRADGIAVIRYPSRGRSIGARTLLLGIVEEPGSN